jgi:hypothetical protein
MPADDHAQPPRPFPALNTTALGGRCPQCGAARRCFDTDPDPSACPACGHLTRVDDLLEPALTVFTPLRTGRYDLLDKVGEGGSSEVWKAWDGTLGRTVALKRTRPGAAALDRDDRARLARECVVAARLRHPHIVSLLDADGEAEQPWLALEFIHGPSLASLLRAGPPAVRVAAEWVRALAAALAHIHALGVVHRDIKPGNILLDPAKIGEATGGFVPRLADFGLARLGEDSRLTSNAFAAGTPAYMAPERLDGQGNDDARGDVYSLGVVLYELLTGRVPFEETGAQLLVAVQKTPPPPADRIRHAVPPDLAAIAGRCLEKDPARRYPDAASLAADLQRWLDGYAVLARPVGPLGRFARWTRREPQVAALAAALALAVTGFGAFSTAQWYRATEAAAEARRGRALAETLAARAEAAAAEARFQRDQAEQTAKLRARAELASADAERRYLETATEPAESFGLRSEADRREERALRLVGMLLDASLPLNPSDPAGPNRLRAIDAFYNRIPTGELISASRLLTLAEIQANRALIAGALGDASLADFHARAAAETLAKARTGDIGAFGDDAAGHRERLRAVETRVARTPGNRITQPSSNQRE